jgi:hypothetical protein
MKKKFFALMSLIFAVAFSVCLLAACGSSTKGLAYSSCSSDSYACTGRGTSTDTKIVIADTQSVDNNTYKVTMISSKAFYNTDITSVKLGSNVTSIMAYAFEDCESLEQVTLPNGLTYIGECAFENCTSLKRITIPESVTSINCSAFKGCKSLTEITFKSSDTTTSWKIYDTLYSKTIKSNVVPNINTVKGVDYASKNFYLQKTSN